MPSTTPRSSPRRDSSLVNARRESVWNLISKFPTPFTPDLGARKARESRRHKRPKLAPIEIPGDPTFSFLDMSSPIETPSLKTTFPYQRHSKPVAELQPTLDASPGSLYSVSLGPDLDAGYAGRLPRRPSSEIHLRSYWSDDSSNEDDGADDDEDRSSPLSPTFLNAWRNRLGRTSTISHRHSRSLPPALTPLSPLSKPRPGACGHVKPLGPDGREEISIRQALEDGPVVAAVPKAWSHRVSHKQAVEDVALQFGQWRGFSSK